MSAEQDAKERARLNAAWEATEAVTDLRDNVEAFAWKNDLKFDAAGMSAALRFASAHVAKNGPLPSSGLVAS